MLPEALLETVRHVWSTLQPTGTKTAVIGGIALSMWEHLRATKDADLLVALSPKDLPQILKALRLAGVQPIHDPPVLDLGDTKILQLEYEPPEAFVAVRIDLMLAESEFHETALTRSVPVQLPGAEFDIQVVACEDLILLKLLAGRIIDRSDAAYLLRHNRDSLDLSHLISWAERLNVYTKLIPIWDEAFPGETPPPLD